MLLSKDGAAKIDSQEMVFYGFILLVVGLIAFFNYRFDLVAFSWKALRLPSLILSDYLIPDSLEQFFNYRPSDALQWVQNNPSSSYTFEILLTIEREYLWASRILIAASLIFAAIQIPKLGKIGGNALDAEGYLKKVVPHVPGEEPLVDFDPSHIPLDYDFSLSPNQNAFRMPISLVPFISCYPPAGFKSSEIKRPICLGKHWEDYQREIAVKVFSRQLGAKLPAKISQFPYHLKKATAIMLARFPDAKEKAQVLKRLSKRHYYARTFLMGLLKEAQKKGVLPPKRFRFILHSKDRLMYLALYGVRSRLSWYEVVGIVSHFQYETALNQRIKEPQIELALVELEYSIDKLQSQDCAEHNVYA